MIQQSEGALGTRPEATPVSAPLSPVAIYIIAGCVCGATLVVLAHDAPELHHWFVLPVLFCGILVTAETIDWLRGEMDRFDPRGLIGLLGFHFFFLAPLLHVRWGYCMEEVTAPPDWREWLGNMAMLNAVGLLIYRLCVGGRVMPAEAPAKRIWALNETRFYVLLALALPATAVLQTMVYASYGGIVGYIEAATYVSESPRNSMPGMGALFMVTETVPILALMGFVAYARRHPRCQSWVVLMLALTVFFALAMLFGGLRGNRSNTVWNLFWAVGIVHFWIRPIPIRLIFAGLLFLTLFMYAYGLFKGAGLNAVVALESKEAHETLAAETGRRLESTILDDFGRSDVQAYLLYRMTAADSDYEYALGRTYAVAPAILLPRSLWPDRPPNMAKEGTEAQFGMGTYDPTVVESSRVYGLAGEAMLNFGPIAVPFAFLLWGLAVNYIRHRPACWAPGDVRFLLYPLAVVVAFATVFQDTENQLYFVIKFGAVPIALLWLAMRIENAPAPTGDTA
jgi:hypothetical protein